MTSKPPTPGLKVVFCVVQFHSYFQYRHYSPQAEVIVVQSDSEEKMKDYIISLSV